jgi:hypothetical protein
MTNQEFSTQFDVLYNNETSNQAPNLNEYEKSVFATKAGIEVVKNYFRTGNNNSKLGYDDDPKRQIDFSPLIRESTSYKFPSDVLAVIREEVVEVISDGNTSTRSIKNVVPISDIEYVRLTSKPYGRPLKNQVWRRKVNPARNIDFELIGHYPKTNSRVTSSFANYRMIYIKVPNPIILWSSTDEDYVGLTIQGYPSNGGFPPIDIPDELMQEVLQRAVELAKIAWQGDLSATLTGGQRSE